MERSFLNSNLPNSKMKIDWNDFNVKADYVIETIVKPQVAKYELSKQINKYTMEKQTFEQAVKPLMKWLSENTHPHTTAIVTGNLAELVEGVEVVKTDEFLID
jgi:hypothetical protein